ncbi:hypothetical protein D9M71_510000 [compost metagenome]
MNPGTRPCPDRRRGSDLTVEQAAALLRFAEKHGRFWKSRLMESWLRDADLRDPDGALLRQVRNTITLNRLRLLRMEDLRNAAKEVIGC